MKDERICLDLCAVVQYSTLQTRRGLKDIVDAPAIFRDYILYSSIISRTELSIKRNPQ